MPDTLFRSNNGAGPLLARILAVKDGIVYLERWTEKGKRRTRFTLTEKFLQSPRCGWKRVERK